MYVDDYKIVSGGGDGTIRVCRPLSFVCLMCTNDALSHASRTTSSDSRTFSLQVWDYRGTSDAPLYTIQAHTRDIINMDVHENAFASGSLDDSLKMWLIG